MLGCMVGYGLRPNPPYNRVLIWLAASAIRIGSGTSAGLWRREIGGKGRRNEYQTCPGNN
jgi:hypothetical protein